VGGSRSLGLRDCRNCEHCSDRQCGNQGLHDNSPIYIFHGAPLSGRAPKRQSHRARYSPAKRNCFEAKIGSTVPLQVAAIQKANDLPDLGSQAMRTDTRPGRHCGAMSLHFGKIISGKRE